MPFHNIPTNNVYKFNEPLKPTHSHKKMIIVGVVVAILLLGLGIFFGTSLFRKNQLSQPANSEVSTEAAVPIEVKEKAPEPEFDAKAIQSVISDWTTSHKGVYSISVADNKGKVLAKHQPEKTFFAASIYKLYVAYVGYQKIDDGTYAASETYLNGWSRGKCLDEMIRTSNSPCAEKMWAELGKESLNTTLKEYGLTDTSMTGLTTSPRDATRMLARIEQGTGLSAESRKAFLASMKGQIYRDALPKGFAPATVYDKVGFREAVEYHDVAIVELPNKKRVIVSVMTQSAGSANIAGLAKELLAALQE